MDIIGDYANEYQFLEGVLSGTLSPRQPTTADITGVQYKPKKLSKAQIDFSMASGGLRKLSISIILWTSTTGGFVPDAADEFTTADDKQWRILMVTVMPAGSAVDCLLESQQ